MTKRKKTPKRLTKRERKELEGKGPSGHQQAHIHCVACGRHIDGGELTANPATAGWVICEHKSKFASCTGCVPAAKRLLAEHDRTGRPVKQASAWH
jgi:hypothetical protein